jgi:hypothetical protein
MEVIVAETPKRESEKKTPHDVEYKKVPSTGGEDPRPPDPGDIEQGSKPSEVRDKGDKADRPNP